MIFTFLDSPVGRLLLAGNDRGLHRIDFQNGQRPFTPPPDWRRDAAFLREPCAQLDAYFRGERRVFELPLVLSGTAFQNQVWRELAAIPFGQTISYGELARRIGRPNASRAVGAANGSNPLPLILPCHRVVGSDGSLTGYGGGLGIKERLLRFEAGLLAGAQLSLFE